MRLSQFALLCLAPVALGVITVGCGGDGDDGSSGESLSLEERLFRGNEADAAEQQQLIRECMVKQGFEYTPRDTREAEGGGPREADPRSEEFVKEYGFGISTLFASEIKFDAGDDPNREYRDSLSEAQKSAYDKALYGQDFGGASGGFVTTGGGPAIAIPIGGGDVAAAEGGVFTPKAPEGCVGEALKATGADANPFDSGIFDELQDLEDRIKADPKIVESMKKWSACMDGAGYDYRDIDSALDEIRGEFAEIAGFEMSEDGGGFSISVQATGPGGDDGPKTFDPLANADPAKLAELQAKEKRIALATFECAEKDLLPTEQKVREKYEAEFLADHPELEAD